MPNCPIGCSLRSSQPARLVGLCRNRGVGQALQCMPVLAEARMASDRESAYAVGAEHSFSSLCKAALLPSVWLCFTCSLGVGSLQADSWECDEPCMTGLPCSSPACNNKLWSAGTSPGLHAGVQDCVCCHQPAPWSFLWVPLLMSLWKGQADLPARALGSSKEFKFVLSWQNACHSCSVAGQWTSPDQSSRWAWTWGSSCRTCPGTSQGRLSKSCRGGRVAQIRDKEKAPEHYWSIQICLPMPKHSSLHTTASSSAAVMP